MRPKAIKIVSYQKALKLGLKRYFTGNPCIRGYVAERLVSSRNCLCPACAAEANKRVTAYLKRKRSAAKEAAKAGEV